MKTSSPPPPRLFSPAVSADLDYIAAITGVAPSSVDVAALTVLAGVIGQRVAIPAQGGYLQPVSLLTAVTVPPLAECARLSRLLTGEIIARADEVRNRWHGANIPAKLDELKRKEEMLQGDGGSEAEEQNLRTEIAEAKFVAQSAVLEHDPGIMGVSTTLERAHDRALLVCYSSNYLLGEFKEGREILGQFLQQGVHGQLSLKKNPADGFVISALSIVQQNAVPMFMQWHGENHDVIPFMLVDERAEFGAQFFEQSQITGAWPALAATFFRERVLGDHRTLALPPDTYRVINGLVSGSVEPLIVGNPALAPFFSTAASVLLRTAAIVSLADDIQTKSVSTSALMTAAGFCHHWFGSHARALAKHLPKPSPRRRSVIVHADLATDRNILIDHIRRRGGMSWRNIRMALPRARSARYWEQMLSVMKQSGRVSIGPKRTVQLNAPPAGVDSETYYSLVRDVEPRLGDLWNQGEGGKQSQEPHCQQNPESPSSSALL